VRRIIDEASEQGSIKKCLSNPGLMTALRTVVARAVNRGQLPERAKGTHEKRLLRKLRKRVEEPD
jgi:hypothetical protein